MELLSVCLSLPHMRKRKTHKKQWTDTRSLKAIDDFCNLIGCLLFSYSLSPHSLITTNKISFNISRRAFWYVLYYSRTITDNVTTIFNKQKSAVFFWKYHSYFSLYHTPVLPMNRQCEIMLWESNGNIHFIHRH